jgi:S-adenosylmethionine hydrolase
MAEHLLTLTTDFGTRSPFVAAMKGVILNINPAARILDLSHEIPPFDLRHAAFFLAEALPYFPPDTLHVVVVDPEVGSSRALLLVSVAGQRVLVPDNGCWTLLAERYPDSLTVLRVEQQRLFRPQISSTFHGRDILAPVAAYLSLGIPSSEVGPPTHTWRKLDWPTPVHAPDGVHGEIVFVDHFGNLISNIAGSLVSAGSWVGIGSPTAKPKPARLVRTYADASPGELVALVSSSGLLEVAIVQGNAAQQLGAGVGTPIHLG